MYFDGNLMFFNQEFNGKDELFKFIGDNFEKAGYVTADFVNGIRKRESLYPTGLVLQDCCVAIPHTDADKVVKSQLQFITLKKPVKFFQMADNTSEIEVNFVVSLALKEAHAQLEMLQKLMGMFADADLMKKLLACSNIEETKALFAANGIE